MGAKERARKSQSRCDDAVRESGLRVHAFLFQSIYKRGRCLMCCGNKEEDRSALYKQIWATSYDPPWPSGVVVVHSDYRTTTYVGMYYLCQRDLPLFSEQ